MRLLPLPALLLRTSKAAINAGEEERVLLRFAVLLAGGSPEVQVSKCAGLVVLVSLAG